MQAIVFRNARFDGTPESWLREPFVQAHLAPWVGQHFHAAGHEMWDELPYVLLDWRDGSGRLMSRFAGFVMWCWNPFFHAHVDETLPWMPRPGLSMIVTQARVREFKWDHLVLCHGQHNGRGILWKIKIQGCYRPPPPPPRHRSLAPLRRSRVHEAYEGALSLVPTRSQREYVTV